MKKTIEIEKVYTLDTLSRLNRTLFNHKRSKCPDCKYGTICGIVQKIEQEMFNNKRKIE